MKKNYFFILLCCFNILILSKPASGLSEPVHTINVNSFLPVRLYSFNASHGDGKDLLTWNVSVSPNLVEFQIERSDNGQLFFTVDSVFPKTVSSDVAAYDFYSPDLVTGTRYYRLKLLYNDGSFDYSSIVTLDDGTSNRVVILYSGSKQFQLVTPYSLKTVNIVNGSGEVVIRYPQVAAGSLIINMNNFAPGIYWVQCLNDKPEILKVFLQ